MLYLRAIDKDQTEEELPALVEECETPQDAACQKFARILNIDGYTDEEKAEALANIVKALADNGIENYIIEEHYHPHTDYVCANVRTWTYEGGALISMWDSTVVGEPL